MKAKIEESWKEKLEKEFSKEYFISLSKFVKQEYSTKKVFPPEDKIFEAFNLCTFENTKVVILGQDPYHGINQAHGLCFSVNKEEKIPPSLINIFKEINTDLGIPIPNNGNLKKWANQGVLLLNATLTVRATEAGSHQNKGWELFTDSVIKLLADKKEPLVFLLWGAYAQKKGKIINRKKHLVLESVHPSPLAAYRGFFGNKHFSKVNTYLNEKGLEKIEW